MKQINIPDRNQCVSLAEKMAMMPHIMDHSLRVQQVTKLLCKMLQPVHTGLNPALASAAALLHDITKTRSFTTGEQHARTGGELLADMGFAEVGDIVRQHVVLDTYCVNGSVTESEIVNYSDKRVLHDQVVPLDDRLVYIKEKYATNPEFESRIKEMWGNTRILEKKLFKGLTVTPQMIREMVDAGDEAQG